MFYSSRVSTRSTSRKSSRKSSRSSKKTRSISTATRKNQKKREQMKKTRMARRRRKRMSTILSGGGIINDIKTLYRETIYLATEKINNLYGEKTTSLPPSPSEQNLVSKK